MQPFPPIGGLNLGQICTMFDQAPQTVSVWLMPNSNDGKAHNPPLEARQGREGESFPALAPRCLGYPILRAADELAKAVNRQNT